MSQQFTWVHIPGAVVRFETELIEEFNKEFKSLSKIVEGIDYWDCFSWHFAEELNGYPTYGFRPY